ncbi:MAG: hypothetical protein E7635_02720 [Ruminococcaceae bacterium]|nr:hypothetical protein [Oscillospiraceae bacterium]
MKRRMITVLLISMILFINMPEHIMALEQTDLSEIEDHIPDDIRDKLPENVFNNTPGDKSSSFSFSYFAKLIADTFKAALGDSSKALISLIGMVLLSSLFYSLSGCAGNSGELSRGFSSISGLCVCVYIFTSVASLFDIVYTYLNSLASFANALTPFITIAYAAGGNINAASVSSTGLLLCITVIENMNAYLLFPVLRLSAVMTIASSAAPSLKTGVLGRFLRGFLMLLIGLTVAAISAIMSFQQTLAASADSLTARAVRFAASSFIPIVGSAVSDAIRTVSGSISYIRTSVGGIGIIVIVIMTLPLFATLMLSRINLALCASLSDMLGCERECKTLKEAGGLVNFLIALVSLTAVMFIYALTLLVRCTVSYGA